MLLIWCNWVVYVLWFKENIKAMFNQVNLFVMINQNAYNNYCIAFASELKTGFRIIIKSCKLKLNVYIFVLQLHG